MNRDRLMEVIKKLPPHAVEAEISLIGSVFIDPNRYLETNHLVPGDFSRPAHQIIWGAIQNVYESCGTIDIVLVHQWIVDNGQSDLVGGAPRLIEIVNGTPHARNAAHYAKLVKGKSVLRQIIILCSDTLFDAHTEPDLEHVYRRLLSRMAKVKDAYGENQSQRRPDGEGG